MKYRDTLKIQNRLNMSPTEPFVMVIGPDHNTLLDRSILDPALPHKAYTAAFTRPLASISCKTPIVFNDELMFTAVLAKAFHQGTVAVIAGDQGQSTN